MAEQRESMEAANQALPSLDHSFLFPANLFMAKNGLNRLKGL